jgi:predicted dinucleotide-binding enzyme
VAISDSTVAIIGTGTIGSTLAANLAAGGQDFLLAALGRVVTKTEALKAI